MKIAIGIDFLMPQKTQRRRHPRNARFMLSLELDGRPISQGRMQSLQIVDLLDELCNMVAQFLKRTILPGIEFFMLQRLDEALAPPVLPRTAWPAHAQHRAA